MTSGKVFVLCVFPQAAAGREREGAELLIGKSRFLEHYPSHPMFVKTNAGLHLHLARIFQGLSDK